MKKTEREQIAQTLLNAADTLEACGEDLAMEEECVEGEDEEDMALAPDEDDAYGGLLDDDTAYGGALDDENNYGGLTDADEEDEEDLAPDIALRASKTAKGWVAHAQIPGAPVVVGSGASEVEALYRASLLAAAYLDEAEETGVVSAKRMTPSARRKMEQRAKRNAGKGKKVYHSVGSVSKGRKGGWKATAVFSRKGIKSKDGKPRKFNQQVRLGGKSKPILKVQGGKLMVTSEDSKSGKRGTYQYGSKTKASVEAPTVVTAAESSLVVPQVNSNGTSKKELMAQLLAAAHAGRAFQKALEEMSPHGRDYQTAPSGAYQEARKQHMDREQRVVSVMKELQDIALQLSDQGRD